MVPVSVVARWTGRCSRTIIRWVNDRIIPGVLVRGARHKLGRWYVPHDTATDLREGRMPSAEAVAAWYARRGHDTATPASRVRAVRKAP
jgi:hypothetical protein